MEFIFFFTIPGWIIFALLFLAVGVLDISVDWIASHWLIIAICAIVLCVLFLLLLTKRGQRLWGFSILSVFSGVFVFLTAYLMGVARLYNAGKTGSAIFDAVAGGFILFLVFCAASYVLIEQLDTEDPKVRKGQIKRNFLLWTPLMYIPFMIFYL